MRKTFSLFSITNMSVIYDRTFGHCQSEEITFQTVLWYLLPCFFCWLYCKGARQHAGTAGPTIFLVVSISLQMEAPLQALVKIKTTVLSPPPPCARIARKFLIFLFLNMFVNSSPGLSLL